MIRIVVLLLLILNVKPLYTDEEYKFAGRHFLASYMGCDQKALADITAMVESMDKAVQSSGATVLEKALHVFPPNGLTLVYLLSESHASIHTYPELGACFVDLFTCGDHCHSQPFDEALRLYLKPKLVNARLFNRHEELEEIKF